MVNIPFCHYILSRDRYCVSYAGACNEYLIQLRLARPHIERQLPGVRLYIGYRDGAEYLLGGEPRTLPASQVRDRRVEFGHVLDLRCDMRTHPVWDLVSGFRVCADEPIAPGPTGPKCVVVPKGVLPTRPLSATQTEALVRRLSATGLSVTVGGDADGAGVVAGVESEPLFAAAAAGKRTILVDTGLGADLYRAMFPHTGGVLQLEELS